jgi:two-component system phosphate regulon sensor histidine kinase PhoR
MDLFVRRSKLLSKLVWLFVAGGIVCVVYNMMRQPGALRSLSVLEVSGTTLFLLSAIAGRMAITTNRRDCRMLVNALRERFDAQHLHALNSPNVEFNELVESINQFTEGSAQAVTDARLKLKELEIELKVATAERQHAEAIIYSISDAVLVTDPFDEVVLANEAAARTFDFELARANRAPLEQILRDSKMIEMIREMRQSDTKSGQRIVEHQVKTNEGDRTFKITLACVSNQSVKSTGVVTVMHDMTREKEVADMKNDFVSNVSHELRTPLASIKAYVEMLIDGEADDEKTKREFYEVIQNESNRLSRLIDNILNISRIESGLVKINKQPQSLMVIMKEAIEVITPQARMKQIQVVEQLTPAFYQTMADKDMLYQAVLNLLSNSVKYTPEGGSITVSNTVDEAKKKVCVRISDTGVGIPPKDLPFVFDKFYRAEANNRMAKGTGLGLSLVKHIVETVHRGRIFVESHIGKGSCFGFELDLCE